MPKATSAQTAAATSVRATYSETAARGRAAVTGLLACVSLWVTAR